MELKTFFAQDAQGNVIPSPTVYLYQPGTTTLVTGLQNATGGSLTNPFTGTIQGQLALAAPDGNYDLRVTGAGRDYTMRVRFIDASANSAIILREDLAAPGGSALVGTVAPSANAVSGLVSDKLHETRSLQDFLTTGQKGLLRDGLRFDATTALQNALNSGERKILLPRQEIHIDGNLTTPSSTKFGVVVGGIELVGQGSNRFGLGRTTIQFHGTGTMLMNGSDDGGAWDAGSYNGPEGLSLTNITIFAPDGTTPLSNGDGESYTPGTVAIADWRGGNIKLKSVSIMRFDKPFFAIQSDFDTFEDLIIAQNHSAMYFGPRSDQLHLKDVQSYHNDSSLELDSCLGATITNYTSHGDGYGSVLPIYIKANYLRGQGATALPATGITFNSLWLEHQPLESVGAIDAFVGIGVDSTYPVGNVVFNSPIILNSLAPTANRAKSLAKIAKAKGVYFNLPASFYDKFVHLDQVVEFIGTSSAEGVQINLGNQIVALPWINSGTGFPDVKVTGQDYDKESASSALPYVWSSDLTDVYETLTITGQTIQSAINSTGAGQVNTNAFTTFAGDVKCMEINLTINSGAGPAFTSLSGDGSTNIVQALVAGVNRVIWVERASGVNGRMWLRNFSGSAGNWSATTKLTQNQKSTIGDSSLQSASHGAIVRSSVTNAATPTPGAATFDIRTGVPSGAKLLGARLLVTAALPAGETWSAAYFDGSTTSIAAAGQAVAQNTVVIKNQADEITTNSPRIRITRDSGNFTGTGQISATVFYEVIN